MVADVSIKIRPRPRYYYLGQPGLEQAVSLSSDIRILRPSFEFVIIINRAVALLERRNAIFTALGRGGGG